MIGRKSQTRLDYAERIARVATHIAGHLDDDLSLERLAGIACLSPYHFHRIYRAMTGETAAETARRLRLHRAAHSLVASQLPIARIAARAGYGSVAAFTRAFAVSYGHAPAAYRRRGRLLPGAGCPQEEDGPMTSPWTVTLQPMPALRLATIHHVGPYMEIGRAFDRLMPWAAARGLLGPGAVTVGVYYDDPGTVAAKDLSADAGISIGREIEGDATVHIVLIAAGTHAVLRHRGPYAELERAYDWLYRAWLPASGHEPADRPPYEIYRNDPREVPAQDLVTDICLPLADV
ncbi:AraC family transcriptional regulator [Chelatococcus daeguensis]|uniref:AraC family transcriptional regulator n=2 Tax=Chelatococcus TaxID=28209 RepID=A0AAC9NYX6_9HYPH|nr:MULTISPECIES: AraC family transcriptional regulator [Chelatococcus]APF37984.1 AraC family transcriptional regulator [Chelatococcus daeguensis]KZE28486.1 transcriptional regulator [Chelatococcus daeguensis]MBM3083440.1 AraC family transcriptional regulator [Chelatococcus daeguensis]CUA83991.1 DNA gyrase inhibitor GyrI [Chelatococcus sambhunathii]